MVSSLRILIYNCLLIGAAMQFAGAALDLPPQDGLALVTTSKGEVVFTSPDGKTKNAKLHAVETLTGKEVTTGEDNYVFFSLSNGSGLGVYENSQVRFVSYRQRPFPPERESLEYEPTRSTLVIQLTEGSLSFSAEHLSPLSKAIIEIPTDNIEIEIHEASGRVLYDEAGTLISVSSGIVSYRYPGVEEQEFITGPNRVRLSKQGDQFGPVTDFNKNSDPSLALTEQLVKATRQAIKRAIFKVPSDEASIPRPVLVAKPEAFQKPTPRPYRYID